MRFDSVLSSEWIIFMSVFKGQEVIVGERDDSRKQYAYRKATVTRVGRKYFYLISILGREQQFNISDLKEVVQSCPSTVYLDKSTLEENLTKTKVHQELAQFFGYGNLHKITYKQMVAICDILGVLENVKEYVKEQLKDL